VQRLLDADIIEPARSPWRAQALVVKQDEKKRLVIDYSSTINRFTLLDAYPLPNTEDLVNRIARDMYFSSIDLRLAYHQVPLLAEERHYRVFFHVNLIFCNTTSALGVLFPFSKTLR